MAGNPYVPLISSKTYTSKIDGTATTYNISRIEKTIEELTDRLKRIQSGQGVKDYINIVYVKSAIDKNPDISPSSINLNPKPLGSPYFLVSKISGITCLA